MRPVREELIIAGTNKELTSYLIKMALAILETASDIRNIKIDSQKDTCYNVTLTYSRNPEGAWANSTKRK